MQADAVAATADEIHSPTTATARLVSLNVGMPKDVAWQGRTIHTGVFKHPVQGRRMVRRLNVDGDGQGDTAGHGGEQRAVLVYQRQSYEYWQQHFGWTDFSYGQFGENLTVDGLSDDEVCIGDRYQIGEAEFEVTAPRVTCYRVGMRLGEPELPALLVSHHRPGFYMRVIREGHVEAGDLIIKTVSGPGALSVADTDALLYLPDRSLDTLRVAVDIPALSPGWRQSFQDLLADDGSAAAGTGLRAEAKPAWSGFRSLTVTRVVTETATVRSIYLAAPDGSPLPPAHAGQYLTLRILGAGEPAPVRNYSLSSAATADGYRISVKREPHGAASSYLTRKLVPGANLEVAAGRGEFVLDSGTEAVLLISAGIGVTPLLAMLAQLAAERNDRDIWWIHSARGSKDHALGEEAHTMLAGLPNTHEHVFYTAATEAECRRAHATPGRLTAKSLRQLRVPVEATAYLCGPAGFMADIQQALEAVGIMPSRIRTEVFQALGAINPGLTDKSRPSPHQPAGPPGSGPLVTFSRSGISTRFGGAFRSVLELADACDINTRWSCRTGVCHTCITPLLSGTVSYRPTPLDAPDEGEVLICCAQPDTDLVLEM